MQNIYMYVNQFVQLFCHFYFISPLDIVQIFFFVTFDVQSKWLDFNLLLKLCYLQLDNLFVMELVILNALLC